MQLLGGANHFLGFVDGSALFVDKVQAETDEVDAGNDEHDDWRKGDQGVVEGEVLDVEEH